ncbi:MAG: type II toxin-antitoxin system Phd/YefM family antitoxin [Candidatus Dormibacter sp.]|uniref:type II toxin-antitoxin system Phd/YefM family antitoxin n=1 Tax=Candidatus Dormibacter sp. TaxID=2973982 RepID=UPI003D9B2B01
MKSLTIGIREAKAQLSRLVSEVERGTEWIITDRGRPVARLTPLNDLETSLEHRISRLEKWGWIEGAARVKAPVPPPIRIGADAQSALQEDRGA